jgi:hypothetical protein
MVGRYGYSRRTSEYRERWYSYIDWAPIAMIAGTVLALGVVAWLIVLSAQEHARWEQWCWDEGGRVDKNTSLGIGYVDGKQVTTTNTTYYCLTSDGRILDIKG